MFSLEGIMDFNTFKQKTKDAGIKIGLLSKASFQNVCTMIQDDEKLMLGFEIYPEKSTGLVGVAIITEYNFYGQIPQGDKTFQSVTISRSSINNIVFPDKEIKIFKLETTEGFIDIGKILDYKIYTPLKQLLCKGNNSVNIISPEKQDNNINIGDTTKNEVESFYSSFPSQQKEEHKLRCPKCASENIEPIPITKGKTKGFGLGKAAVGGLVLGPLGLAAGVIGMGKGKTTTDIMWICKSCGKQFDKPKNK